VGPVRTAGGSRRRQFRLHGGRRLKEAAARGVRTGLDTSKIVGHDQHRATERLAVSSQNRRTTGWRGRFARSRLPVVHRRPAAHRPCLPSRHERIAGALTFRPPDSSARVWASRHPAPTSDSHLGGLGSWPLPSRHAPDLKRHASTLSIARTPAQMVELETEPSCSFAHRPPLPLAQPVDKDAPLIHTFNPPIDDRARPGNCSTCSCQSPEAPTTATTSPRFDREDRPPSLTFDRQVLSSR